MAASAAVARPCNVVRNAGVCPMKMFEFVNAANAATAPEFGVVPGLITEHGGRLGSMNAHGSGMIKFVWRDSSPSNVDRSGNVTPGTLTAGAFPALSCQMAK